MSMADAASLDPTTGWLSQSTDRMDSSTIVDKLFWGMCTANGFSLGLKRNRLLKILCVTLWLASALLYCAGVPVYVNRAMSLEESHGNFLSRVNTITGVLFLFIGLYWKLFFILKNEDLGPGAWKRGRRFRDILPFLFYYSPYLFLSVVGFFRSSFHHKLCSIVFLLHDSLRVISFALYNDALDEILNMQTQLKISAEISGTSVVDSAIARKWQIRDKITKVNELFALPLIIHYLHFLTMVLYILSEFFGNPQKQEELVVSIVCLFSTSSQVISLARKGSAIESHNSQLEGHFFKKTLIRDNVNRIDPDVFDIFRIRDECDFLKVATFNVDFQNFLRYLTFCVTFVSVVLQFDYKIVQYVSSLGQETLARSG